MLIWLSVFFPFYIVILLYSNTTQCTLICKLIKLIMHRNRFISEQFIKYWFEVHLRTKSHIICTLHLIHRMDSACILNFTNIQMKNIIIIHILMPSPIPHHHKNVTPSIPSVESQKSVNAVQIMFSVEDQKGAIAVQSLWWQRLSGSQRNIVEQL